jgi:hypothetical protein
MPRVAVRQPPAFTSEGQSVSKEAKEVARELEKVKESLPEQRVIVGAIVLFSSGQEPGSKWRVCAGATINRFDYPEAFDVLGEDHGAGDGATTINLPDLTAAQPAGFQYWIYIGRE